MEPLRLLRQLVDVMAACRAAVLGGKFGAGVGAMLTMGV
jgi:hypothetical protein